MLIIGLGFAHTAHAIHSILRYTALKFSILPGKKRNHVLTTG